MSTPPLQPTVLDWFRSRRDEPIIQFLTWYIILTLEWKFEDMAEVKISELAPQTMGSVIYHRWSWQFTFDNGIISSLLVKGAYDRYHVDSQTTVYHPSGEQSGK